MKKNVKKLYILCLLLHINLMQDYQVSVVLESIKEFFNKKSGDPVKIDSLDLQSFKEKKYSPPIWRLVLNETPLKRNNPYKLNYSCPKCKLS